MTPNISASDLGSAPDARNARPRDGVASDIESLYRARFPQLLRVARAIVGDGEAAREVVQEAFAKALGETGSLRQRASLEPWIWQTVVNSARDRRRSDGSRRAREAGAAPLEGLEAPAAPAGRDSALFAAIAALPERQRHVLFLRHYADLDYRTIAQTLAIRPGTVAATLHAAQASLRTRLEEGT